MLDRALQYLEEKHSCPHCNTELTLCHAPPMHVGDGLGWGSEFLFICLNNDCSLFVNGWKFIENQYGHVGSYRYMEIPNSNESYNMMVAGKDAYTGNIVDVEQLKAQNKRYKKEKEAVAALDSCVEKGDLEPVMILILDEHANKADRKRAMELLLELNTTDCIEPLKNHVFRDSDIEQRVNMIIRGILDKNFLKECPYCAELIKSRATVCKHCQKDLG
ncbi:MAG: zinc ribbon domain-containing protein [Desulfobulbus propionicus]|nr:MAG: zinc ribbon domain-containing protein [Desulfobulbus propionicus]